MSNTTIVIARYNEDINWIKNLNINYILYNKNKNDIPEINNVINIDNIGREEYCYLEYIISHYHSLPERVIFTQAKFEPHNPYFVKLLDKIHLFGDVQPLSSCYNNHIPQSYLKEFSFPYLNISGYPIHIDFFNYTLHRYYKPLNTFVPVGGQFPLKHFLNFFKTEDIRSSLFGVLNLKTRNFEQLEMTPSCYSAIFSVTKEVIMQYPKSYYEQLFNTNKKLAKLHPIYFGWIMELMWLELFQYNPPIELYKRDLA